MTTTTARKATLAGLSALLLFAMLWIPVGQMDFMVDHWMKVGTFAALFMLVVLFASHPESPDVSDASLMSVAFLAAYIAHQFEEHWVDLLGNRYAFFDYVNALIRRTIGTDDSSLSPLTKEAIYVINTSLVWLVGVIAIVRARSSVFPLLAIVAITLVNGVTHVIAGALTLSYNPGLATSLALFLPLCAVFYAGFLREHADARVLVFWSVAWAIGAHVVMVSGMLAANLFQLIPEFAYFCLLVTWSVLPLFVFSSRSVQ